MLAAPFVRKRYWLLNQNMFFVGITGGIASGKSTVTQIIIERGLPVIDADTIARKVVEPGRKAWKKLKKEFGNDIFHPDGTLNREKLGQIIFENVEQRKKVNLITHPEIIKEMVISAVKVGLKGHPFVFLDIPLLYETGELVRLMHKIIVVNCPKDIQIKRLMARNGLTEDAASLRIASQMPLEEKCACADYVIENSSVIEDTKSQVVKIIDDLQKSKFHYKIRIYMFSILCLLVFVVCYFLGGWKVISGILRGHVKRGILFLIISIGLYFLLRTLPSPFVRGAPIFLLNQEPEV